MMHTINIEHVNKILGYKIKTHQEREELIQQWTRWRKEVCGWAAHCIKEKMKQQAQTLVNNDIMVQPTFNGKTIQKFNELSKLWSLSNPTCMKTEATFTFLAYEIWEKEWEKEFMTMHGWSYDSKIKENIQYTCERQGYEMKGCITKNIKQVKGETVKGMQKQGQTQGHGKTIKKQRDKSEAYTEDKKYIRSKHFTIKITPIENDRKW